MTIRREFRKHARNWEALGGSDPLFGVLSDPTKFDGKWDVDDFFNTGRAHVDHLVRTLADRGVHVGGDRCLDFGCGVGRLTVPLSRHFTHTTGVDVSPSMVRLARRYLPADARCEFVTNRTADLRQFPAASVDFVHSCLVLQHIPPDITIRYIREFFRICRPGGFVVFQLPAETRAQSVIAAEQTLPAAAFNARVVIIDPPAALGASERASLRVAVTNESAVTWRHDIPGGYHICVANHWLHGDGTVAVPDDGRAFLPRTVGPGETVEVRLTVEAPSQIGVSRLEVDLVQERVCWFAQRGSRTARAAVVVEAARAMPPAVSPVAQRASRPSILQWIRQRLKGGTPTFDMYVVPRSRVEETVRASGGQVLHAIDDNAAGASWVSYTYVCRRDAT